MTGTFDGPPASAKPPRSTWTERAVVLGGLALAALYTAASLAAGAGTEAIGPLWLAAIAWTVAASLAAALWQGLRRRDWSAFTGCTLPDGTDERIDWATQTGSYAWEPIAEDNERLMRGD